MGRARIIEHIDESLYRIEILRDTETAEAERTDLQERLELLSRKRWEARQSLRDVERERDALQHSMTDLIELHRQDLLDSLPELTPSDPINPDTADPWDSPESGLEAEMLEAINSARSDAGVSALTRDAGLDLSVQRHALAELSQRRLPRVTAPGGMMPHDRAVAAGFVPDPDIPTVVVLASGNDDLVQVVSRWGDDVLDPAHTHVGIVFVNAPRLYVFAAVLAAEGDAPVVVERNPAVEDSDEAADAVQSIEPPGRDVPQELVDAGRELAEAGVRVRAAKKALLTLEAERDAIDQRINELNDILSNQLIVHAWSIRWDPNMEPGTEVRTFEVPGFFERDAYTSATTLFGIRYNPDGSFPIYDYDYPERAINIIPDFTDIPDSQLTDSRLMTDSAVFVNAALEPGHLRWRLFLRYATITRIDDDPYETCDVVLDQEVSRGQDHLALDPDSEADRTSLNVVIDYPCAGEGMEVGTKVVVAWVDRQPLTARSGTPYVVGYQREPMPCPDQRIWQQLR